MLTVYLLLGFFDSFHFSWLLDILLYDLFSHEHCSLTGFDKFFHTICKAQLSKPA